MKGIKYQLKNIRRDKICIISFLLPVIVGLAINMLSGVSFSSLSETSFGIVKNDLSHKSVQWLQSNGSIAEFENVDELKASVLDPASEMIGVLRDENGIKTFLSGDELQINRIIGNTLPKLYAEREAVVASIIRVIPAANSNDGMKSLLIVITMVTAMFMGCTFNAMSMIGEKEDGIAFINEVLPMTRTDFIAQKVFLGFSGGVLATILTALTCIRVESGHIFLLLLIIILSAFISALAGLYIGHFANGLMGGITYIKILMILFLAPPIITYLVVPAGSTLHLLSYLLPSSATFYGLMDMLNGQVQNIEISIIALLVHCIVWLLLFFILENHRYKKSLV
ncbi:ABC transporter permease [Alkalibaculum sp. M08DMB]|uniref:ABC transporter permease n=1 Tax=Alkalibaculum sporogenes TaxID=2655001 RepID=A0A6A7K834_9FIRM|nr:ABC transporter permease [Alkalibaculum sporogenes]MPW25600.1 ABC transporter permease [Alkalibaculum sporogenes]